MNADDQYQANFAFLTTRPGLEGMVAQLPTVPLVNLQFLPCADGQLFGQVYDRTTDTWAALCSPQNPMEEAEKDCEALYSRDVKVFTLLGLGLGYFATAFAKRLQPWQRMVIWDVDPIMFKAMMHAVDIRPLFSEKRTDVMIGSEVLNQVESWWLRLDAIEKLHIAAPFRSGYTGVSYKPEYDALMEKNIEMMRFHAVGLSTWRIFGSAIGDNDLQNMPEYFTTPGITKLHGLWNRRPAVCLAAGPSLQKNLRQLLDPAVRDRVALITVGTIYALVHGLSLEPDIVTTIDFQDRNWTEQFRHVPLDVACPLVYLHSTYPQTVRRWAGPRFVATNASDTTSWISRYGDDKGSAAQVQTVAHLNVLIALELGANPIILMGQDLAMPLTEHHTAGARAEDIAPADASEEAFIVVQDYAGKPVHTRHSFLSMKTVFERIIAENPTTTFINCSEGGLLLTGAHHMPLGDAMQMMLKADPPIVPVRGELRARVAQVFRDYVPTVKDTFAEEWAQLCEWVEDLIQWATEIGLLLDAARKYSEEQITEDMWAAAAAEDCLTMAEVVDAGACQRWAAIVERERVIQERQPAMALFAIRRFDFLELMAEIPPKEEDVATMVAMMAHNGERLGRVAAMIADEAPVVQRLVREVTRRMEDVLCPSDPGINAIHRMGSRQRYNTALDVLRRTKGQGYRQYQARYLRYLWHTQQYEAVLALAQAWQGIAPRKEALAQRYLAQWRADVRAAMPAYFQETGERSQSDHAEAWLYD